MTAFGLAIVAFSAVVLAMSEHRMSEANPTRRLPSLGNPPNTPRVALNLRALGGGLAVFGATTATFAGRHVGFAIGLALAAWVPNLVVHIRHNRRIEAVTPL